jgi:GMP synthase-like glutamine amidotransferase
MPQVTVLEHLPHEHAGLLGRVLAEDRVAVRTVALHAGERVPRHPVEVGALVVLGGDMNTDQTDAFPHLVDEVRLLGACVEAQTPVLGLCLGAQLLAEATGGKVTHGEPEIGYVPVRRTPEGRRDPLFAAFDDGARTFNAHADQITTGPDAVVLAASAATPVHAFRVGPRAWGVQFHPEFDAALCAGYVRAPGVEGYLRGAGWDPAALLAEARRHDAAHQAMGARLLRRWLSLALGGPSSTGW